jgi:hypothetical protein
VRPLGFRSFWFDHSGRIRCRRRPKKTRQARADPSRCSFSSERRAATSGTLCRFRPQCRRRAPIRSPPGPACKPLGNTDRALGEGFAEQDGVCAIDEWPAAQIISPTAVLPALFRRALALRLVYPCAACDGAHGGRSASSGGGSCRGSRWSSRAQRRAQPPVLRPPTAPAPPIA